MTQLHKGQTESHHRLDHEASLCRQWHLVFPVDALQTVFNELNELHS